MQFIWNIPHLRQRRRKDLTIRNMSRRIATDLLVAVIDPHGVNYIRISKAWLPRVIWRQRADSLYFIFGSLIKVAFLDLRNTFNFYCGQKSNSQSMLFIFQPNPTGAIAFESQLAALFAWLRKLCVTPAQFATHISMDQAPRRRMIALPYNMIR